MKLVESVNPRTGEPAGPGVSETPPAELSSALSLAKSAARRLAVEPITERAALLRAIADRLDDRAEELVPLADTETALGKPRLTAELTRATFQLRLFAETIEEGSFLDVTIDTPSPNAAPGPRPDLRRQLEPLGPVLVFAASNFPFAFGIPGGDTASALASGCPVIVKAHEGHPELSRRVGEIINSVVADHNLPAGIFTVVFGQQAGRDAVVDPRIKAAGFTGSTNGGRALYDLATGRLDPIPFYGELGSINPTVVTKAAARARGTDIATEFVNSFTLDHGQLCTKPGLLFVPVGHKLDSALAEAVSVVPPAPMVNARVAESYAKLSAELSAHSEVRSLITPRLHTEPGAWGVPCLFVTSAESFTESAETLAEECFGPSSLIVEYASTHELINALQAIEGSLTATIHGEQSDLQSLGPVLDVLRPRAGRLIWNDWPTDVPVAWATQHGGPWPSSTNPTHSSVGASAIRRWMRPVAYQAFPQELLPESLKDGNPLGVPRRIDGAIRR
ncbi:aldehyde dehydrogenase (NADP(+)) [Actinobacteria bacterium YIM 96077]|uniref:Aldehyde dehydrogenase (NADP(+)) n=1 Tax=Phytoactinopolyspora halophila TaxID=1981511 RepID=A0A329QB68_9ACTN|nr:aldehyde dehydrogenase (NADP(+)) [Phytoactinopolyspora halophila]AYY15546.1 aldehyde dehydrogenase (NADP(+)) [Actinobacteria bacterium YIM 96077]RAW09487.1 aldehyde dehydrogenase (NADP(+)) [Phytoactinopolyspora halophila]